MTKAIDLWTIKLRSDQVRCVNETLEWVVEMQQGRIDHSIASDIDKFSHGLAIDRINEIRGEFSSLGVAA